MLITCDSQTEKNRKLQPTHSTKYFWNMICSICNIIKYSRNIGMLATKKYYNIFCNISPILHSEFDII